MHLVPDCAGALGLAGGTAVGGRRGVRRLRRSLFQNPFDEGEQGGGIGRRHRFSAGRGHRIRAGGASLVAQGIGGHLGGGTDAPGQLEMVAGGAQHVALLAQQPGGGRRQGCLGRRLLDGLRRDGGRALGERRQQAFQHRRRNGRVGRQAGEPAQRRGVAAVRRNQVQHGPGGVRDRRAVPALELRQRVGGELADHGIAGRRPGEAEQVTGFQFGDLRLLGDVAQEVLHLLLRAEADRPESQRAGEGIVVAERRPGGRLLQPQPEPVRNLPHQGQRVVALEEALGFRPVGQGDHGRPVRHGLLHRLQQRAFRRLGQPGGRGRAAQGHDLGVLRRIGRTGRLRGLRRSRAGEPSA